MPLYITLVNLTDQGIKTIKERAGGDPALSKYLSDLGIKFIGSYLTMGQYDYVYVWEAPSDEAAATGLLADGARGNLRTITLKAFTIEQSNEMIAKLP